MLFVGQLLVVKNQDRMPVHAGVDFLGLRRRQRFTQVDAVDFAPICGPSLAKAYGHDVIPRESETMAPIGRAGDEYPGSCSSEALCYVPSRDLVTAEPDGFLYRSAAVSKGSHRQQTQQWTGYERDEQPQCGIDARGQSFSNCMLTTVIEKPMQLPIVSAEPSNRGGA